jgi:hypothetical protein
MDRMTQAGGEHFGLPFIVAVISDNLLEQS